LTRKKEVDLKSQANVGFLVQEYSNAFSGVKDGSDELLEKLLVHEGDWTQEAASHLIQLAKGYGSFMLQNALAISLALGVEDGEFGF
jgi:hypothetical protein